MNEQHLNLIHNTFNHSTCLLFMRLVAHWRLKMSVQKIIVKKNTYPKRSHQQHQK